MCTKPEMEVCMWEITAHTYGMRRLKRTLTTFDISLQTAGSWSNTECNCNYKVTRNLP